MTKSPHASAPAFTDAELVAQTLAGSREAFADIVRRYQNLVCSVTYSATGSIPQSQDLAQETFLIAWQKLRELRDTASLRSWLCGIARHLHLRARRDQQREPTHAAAPLDAAEAAPAPDAPAAAQAIGREEEAILWRTLEKLPELYREPLVLFYREHHSIEQVANLLEISEDSARQRLSRGRKLLQDEVAAFVEGALRQSKPTEAFCAGVLAALPVPAGLATGAAGTAAAKGGVAGWVTLSVTGLFASLLGSVGLVRLAATARVRRFTVRLLLAMWADCAGLWIALPLTQWLRERHAWTDARFALVQTCCYLAWSMIMATLVIVGYRRFLSFHREIAPAGSPRRIVRPTVSAALTGALMTAGAFAWLIQLTWLAHDLASLAIAGTTAAAVIVWILVSPAWLARSGRDAAALAWVPSAAITGVILALLNLRLDRWLAALRGTDLAGAHRLLPMATVHAATAALLGWIALVIFLTRPRRSATA